jgi:hypothetical protein
MATIEIEDPETGQIVYLDESTGEQVRPPPVVMPIPSLSDQGVETSAVPSEAKMSWGDLAKAALMAPAQGMTLNTLDELVGLVNPEAGQRMQELYGQFQEEYPISSTALELAGPMGVGGYAAKTAARFGKPLVAEAIKAAGSQSFIPQVLKGGISGIASAQGPIEERLLPGVMGATAGGLGGIIGGQAGKAKGTAEQVLQMASEPLSDAEKRIALEIAQQGRGDEFAKRMTQAQQDLSPVETFGEMAGYTPTVQGIARMPEGSDLAAILEGRGRTRPERLQSTFAEGLGGEGKIPTELAQEALQTSRDVREAALQRQYKAGSELYSPLEVAPELTSGKKVTMEEAVSGPKLAKEELKFGKIVGKGEERIQNILDDVADDLGDDVANSVLEPGISTAERTKRIKNIGQRGYENADLLMDEFGKVDRAQWKIIAKNRLRKEVNNLTSELKPKEWRKLLSDIYMGEKEIPTLQNISLAELKTRVLGRVKKINAENAQKDIGAYKGISVEALNKLERNLDKGFKKIFPQIKEADYTYATKTIPEAFGGMGETSRTALRQMTKFNVNNPKQVNRIGKIISDLDPSQVQEIIAGAQNIGKPEMRDAMKKGYVAMLKRDVAQQAPSKVIKYFDSSSNQRQILELLAGKEQSDKILSRLGKEERLGRVEAQVKGGSQTAPVTTALKDLMRMTDQPLPENVTQRAVNMFRQPVAALDALINLAPQFRDKQVKNEIFRIYGLQGATALEKMQQLAPVIRKLEKTGELRDKWMELGARIGARAGTSGARYLTQRNNMEE